MYMLISFSDLENDFINPYELTNRVNRFWMLDYALQLIISAALLGSGNWFAGLLHLGMFGYMMKTYLAGMHTISATDAFRDLPQQKKRRVIMFGFYIATFVLVTYRLIETVIHNLLSPEGRETAKKLFQEAATSHGIHF